MASAAVRLRYLRDLEAIIRKAERLDDRTLRGLFSTLDQARKEVLAQVVSSDWGLAHFRTLQARIERAMSELSTELRRDLGRYQDQKWGDGSKLTDELLAKYGGEAERLHIPLDRRGLAVLKDFSADLIVQVPTETIADVSTRLRLGMLAGKSSHETIREIGRALVDEEGNPAPGVWGDVLTRAEVVYRTEANRVYSVATEARMRQHDEKRPGLRKLWMHSGRPAGRASHIQAGEDYAPGGDPGPIPVDELFTLHVGSDESSGSLPAGEYKCSYPRDPRLPAGLSVGCGCATAPWREAWGE